MGTGISRQNRKNEIQPSQTLNSNDPGNTARQQDKHEYWYWGATGTAQHVTDAHPMEYPHGMQAVSNSSPKGTAENSNSALTPVITQKELESNAYNMNHEKRGMAIIINNKNFEQHLDLSVRTGTDADGMALYLTFQAMGFDVKMYNDQKVQEIQKILFDASKEHHYHLNSDCFMCAILTHGEEQDVLYGTDGKADFKNILSFFKGKDCPGLVGKPKLFFIQACQGNKSDQGVVLDVADSKAVMPREKSIKKIPIEADILRAHSSVPGYCAWRHKKKGSWFIQALTKMLNKNWKKMDLLTMLTHVNQMVAGKMTETEKMQIPMFTSTLTKDVLFTPKES